MMRHMFKPTIFHSSIVLNVNFAIKFQCEHMIIIHFQFNSWTILYPIYYINYIFFLQNYINYINIRVKQAFIIINISDFIFSPYKINCHLCVLIKKIQHIVLTFWISKWFSTLIVFSYKLKLNW